MFKAIAKYFRALGYLVTGRITKAREALSMNTAVIGATYDSVIAEKKKRLISFRDAVASLVGNQEKKKSDLEGVNKGIKKYEKLKSAALGRAKAVLVKHNGDAVAAKADRDYEKYQKTFADFSSTLSEKETRRDELENDIVSMDDQIHKYEMDMRSLLKEFDKIKDEKHATIADVISAKEQQAIADQLSGLAEDRTTEDLTELREMRRKAKAKAKVSYRMAGMDNRHEEEELLAEAESSEANDEFEKLMGLSENDAPMPDLASSETKLPEA